MKIIYIQHPGRYVVVVLSKLSGIVIVGIWVMGSKIERSMSEIKAVMTHTRITFENIMVNIM